MTAVKCSERARKLVPEPEAVNIDPARTDAIAIPLAMPEVAVAAIPDMAVIPSADDEIPARGPIDADVAVRANVNSPVGSNVDTPVGANGVDVNASADARTTTMLLSRRCRGCDSEPKRGQDGKNHGNFLQHIICSTTLLRVVYFPKPAVELPMALISEQADCFSLSEKRRERLLNGAFTPSCSHSVGILCAVMRMTSGRLHRHFLVLQLGALRRLAHTRAVLTIDGAAAFVVAAVRYGSFTA